MSRSEPRWPHMDDDYDVYFCAPTDIPSNYWHSSQMFHDDLERYRRGLSYHRAYTPGTFAFDLVVR